MALIREMILSVLSRTRRSGAASAAAAKATCAAHNKHANSTANFFVNGFQSDVTGVDISLKSFMDVGPGTLMMDLRANFNEQEVSKITPNTLNESTVYDFENQVPTERFIATFDYQTDGAFGGFVRLNYFGGWGDSGGQLAAPDASEAVSYGGALVVDVEGSWQINENFRLSVGAENVLDELPDDDGHFVAELLGVDKSLTSPFGVNGGFWYARLTAEF